MIRNKTGSLYWLCQNQFRYPLQVSLPIVVVVHPSHHVTQGDALPALQPRQVVDEVVDHLHVLAVVVGRQGLALLVLTAGVCCISHSQEGL